MDKKIYASLALHFVGLLTVLLCTTNHTPPNCIIIEPQQFNQYTANNFSVVKHLGHSTHVVECNNSIVIGSRHLDNVVGIQLSHDEYNNICRIKGNPKAEECVIVNNLSDVTDVYHCPDGNYIIQNEYIVFLRKEEFERACS